MRSEVGANEDLVSRKTLAVSRRGIPERHDTTPQGCGAELRDPPDGAAPGMVSRTKTRSA